MIRNATTTGTHVPNVQAARHLAAQLAQNIRDKKRAVAVYRTDLEELRDAERCGFNVAVMYSAEVR